MVGLEKIELHVGESRAQSVGDIFKAIGAVDFGFAFSKAIQIRPVQYGDTFLVIGGENPRTDEIYEFVTSPSLEWKLRDERLDQPRSLMGAFLVPDNYAIC